MSKRINGMRITTGFIIWFLINTSQVFSQQLINYLEEINVPVTYDSISQLFLDYGATLPVVKDFKHYIIDDSSYYFIKSTDSVRYGNPEHQLFWCKICFFSIIRKHDSLVLNIIIRYNIGGITYDRLELTRLQKDKITITLPGNDTWIDYSGYFLPIYYIEHKKIKYEIHNHLNNCPILYSIYSKSSNDITLSDLIMITYFSHFFVYHISN